MNFRLPVDMSWNALRIHAAILLWVLAQMVVREVGAAEKPRVIVSTDIGGSDPDDFQSMVHYLVYADRFETVGLISSPPNQGRAEHILECLDAYAKDYPALVSGSNGYPTPDELRSVVRQGATEAQTGELPEQAISDGARLIADQAGLEDARPLYVLVWGSMTDVAQAVAHRADIVPRLRVYSIGSWNTRNDTKARDYLYHHHPDLWWIESDTTFRGMYMGGDQEDDWGNTTFVKNHVQGHGHLGDFFFAKKPDIKMGDSPSVLYLLHGDPSAPETDHWGGAFIRPDPEKRPHYWHDNPDLNLITQGRNGAITVNKWRRAYLTDWKLRMDRLLAPENQAKDQ